MMNAATGLVSGAAEWASKRVRVGDTDEWRNAASITTDITGNAG